MKSLKKISLICLGILFVLGLTNPVKAAAFSMSVSSSTVEANQTFTVTISGNVTGNIFIYASNGTVSNSQIWIENNAVQVHVTAGSSGTVTVTATPGEGLSDPDGNAVADTSGATLTVMIKNKESAPSKPASPATPSKPNISAKVYDLNLKQLLIDGFELSPVFSSDTTDYDLELPKGITSINIHASGNDASVSVQGAGTHEVHPGDNLIELTTHHPETNTIKTYRIHVYVEEEPTVFLDYKDGQLGIYPSFRGSEALEGFENVEVTIDNQKVLGKTNADGLILLYMIDENGNKDYYVYHENSLIKYQPVIIADRHFISLEIPQNMNTMKGLVQKKVTIDENEYEGFVFEDEQFQKYILLYLMNEKGEIHLYQYEISEGVIQLYSNAAAITQESVEEMQKQLNNMIIIFCITSALAVLIIIILIYLLMKKKAIGS